MPVPPVPDPRRPIVLLAADMRVVDGYPSHAVGHKYVEAVREAAGCLPLLLPALGEAFDVDSCLAVVDGVFLPGAASNVHPSHFDQPVRDPSLPLDPDRDGVTLRLIRTAVERGLPLFGVCRGFQEFNVALGGSLHQAVHAVGDKHDHRADDTLPIEEQYAPAHPVRLLPGSLLRQIAGADEVIVNSVHGQGIDRLAPGLCIEATAPDGLIEGIRVEDAPGFALAVQWHPEWETRRHPHNRRLLEAFGDACRARCVRRMNHEEGRQ
jgi:putative glutamine amidotransferase